MTISAYERLWRRIRIDESGCWVYTGFRNPRGYGYAFSELGRNEPTHRIMYRLARGANPAPGLQLDHLCRNRACCNPDHLEAVTPAENTRRGLTGEATRLRCRAVTHCPAGHAYSPENTFVDSRNCRHCRACNRDRARARNAAQRQATAV